MDDDGEEKEFMECFKKFLVLISDEEDEVFVLKFCGGKKIKGGNVFVVLI